MSNIDKPNKVGRLSVRPFVRAGTPTGQWYVDIPADISETGKRARKVVSTRSAALKLAELLTYKRPVRLVQPSLVNASGQTFSEILHAWLGKQQIRIRLGKKKKASVEKDLTYIKALQKYFGDVPIDGITEDSLEGYQEVRKSKSIKPVTINSEITTLKAILNFCVKKDWLTKCPTVEPLRVPKKYVPLPTTEEVRAVLDELSVHHRLLCLLMLETGCRPSEAYNIKWSSAELTENPQIHLFTEGDWCTDEEWSPKSDETARTIQISDDLAAEFNQLPRTSEWIFPSPRGDKPMGPFRKPLASARRMAAIKLGTKPIKLTPKIFRKCFSTWQAERGVNDMLVQHMIGHAPGSRVTAKHYIHFSEKAKRDAIYSLPEAASPNENSPYVAKKLATYGKNLSYTLKQGSSKLLYCGDNFGAGDERQART